jgi:hypothetical protein
VAICLDRIDVSALGFFIVFPVSLLWPVSIPLVSYTFAGYSVVVLTTALKTNIIHDILRPPLSLEDACLLAKCAAKDENGSFLAHQRHAVLLGLLATDAGRQL